MDRGGRGRGHDRERIRRIRFGLAGLPAARRGQDPGIGNGRLAKRGAQPQIIFGCIQCCKTSPIEERARAVMMGSTKYLSLIADHDCHLVFEKGAPYSDRKWDFISLKSRDGREVSLSTADGFKSSPVELPRAIFDDFLAASLIKQDGSEDQDHRIVFRLTADGVARGLSIAYDAQAHVAVWDEPYDDGLMSASVLYDGISLAEAIRRVVTMPPEQRAKVARIGSSDGRFYELPLIEAIARRSDFPWG